MRKIKRKKINIRTEEFGLTRKQKNEADKINRIPDSSPVLIIMYLLGLLGMIIAIGETLEITESPVFILICAGVTALSFVLWYSYIHHNKYFKYIILGFCGLIILLLIPGWSGLTSSLSSGQPEAVSDNIQNMLPAVLSLVTLLFFYLEFVLRRHSILFILCMGIVILGPAVGMKAELVPVLMIVIFQFGFYVLNTNISLRRSRLKTKGNAKASALSTIVTAVILLIAFIPALITEHIFEDDIFVQVYQADGYLQDGINTLFGNYSTNISDGSVSRGNLRQSGTPLMDLYADDLPEDRLYLKSFVGSTYNGRSWTNAYEPQRALFEYFTQDEDGRGDYRRMRMSFYREPFVIEMINRVSSDYYKRYLRALNELTGLELITYDYDYKSGFGYCFDKNGREVAISSDVPNDIRYEDSMSSYISDQAVTAEDDAPIAYIFKEDCTDEVYGDELSDEIIDYLNDPESSRIKEIFYLDNSRLPSYPTLLSNTSQSEAITDIYSSFGRQNLIYDPEKRAFDIQIADPASSSGYKGSQNLRIEPKGNNLTAVCYPYYPAAGEGYGSVGADSGTTSQPYTIEYYNQSKISMSGRWKDVPDYENFIDEYRTEADELYTYYLTSYPRLQQLCNETKLNTDNVNEVTTFILYTLQTHAKYSKTPGSVPFNSDTIEYFLFDNHQGFCVHFASAAALMYKMYGIPARYVTGYSVHSTDFDELESGITTHDITMNYKMEISDKYAHAWVEIFLKDYGWVPVEVTPTMDGVMNAKYPGFDSAVMSNIMNEHGWKFVVRNSDGNIVSGSDGGDSGFDTDTFIILVLSCILVLSAFSMIVVFARYYWLINRSKNASCRVIFDRLIRMLHYCGLLTDKNGSEKDFAAALSSAVPEISDEEADRIIRILEAESFSESHAPADDEVFVREKYAAAAEALYARQRWFRKPVFRFIMGFR